jgi:hypothetical protein
MVMRNELAVRELHFWANLLGSARTAAAADLEPVSMLSECTHIRYSQDDVTRCFGVVCSGPVAQLPTPHCGCSWLRQGSSAISRSA